MSGLSNISSFSIFCPNSLALFWKNKRLELCDFGLVELCVRLSGLCAVPEVAYAQHGLGWFQELSGKSGIFHAKF